MTCTAAAVQGVYLPRGLHSGVAVVFRGPLLTRKSCTLNTMVPLVFGHCHFFDFFDFDEIVVAGFNRSAIYVAEPVC